MVFWLAFLTAIVGIGAITAGLYSHFDPVGSSRIYGIPVFRRDSFLTALLGPPSVISSPKDTEAQVRAMTTYSQSLATRNVVLGAMVLMVTSYWQYLARFASAAEASVAQCMLGIVLLTGSCVPVQDAWTCYSSSSHAAKMSTKVDWQGWEVYEVVGRRACYLHSIRSLSWIVGGICCLCSR